MNWLDGTCKECGSQFHKPIIKNRIPEYCSRTCSNRSRTKSLDEKIKHFYICQRCGKQFFGKADKLHPPKFCSHECWVYRIIENCVICGKEFITKPSYPHHKMTCSDECKEKFHVIISSAPDRIAHTRIMGSRNKGRQYPERRKDPIKKVCIFCGKEFDIPNRRGCANRDARRFCTKECWYEYIRKDPENSPTYKGGYEPYYGPNWDKQRVLTRKRDNYICQDCGIDEYTYGQELDVHHLIPYRLFGRKNYLIANKIENLVSLCKSCHSKRQK